MSFKDPKIFDNLASPSSLVIAPDSTSVTTASACVLATALSSVESNSFAEVSIIAVSST